MMDNYAHPDPDALFPGPSLYGPPRTNKVEHASGSILTPSKKRGGPYIAITTPGGPNPWAATLAKGGGPVPFAPGSPKFLAIIQRL